MMHADNRPTVSRMKTKYSSSDLSNEPVGRRAHGLLPLGPCEVRVLLLEFLRLCLLRFACLFGYCFPYALLAYH